MTTKPAVGGPAAWQLALDTPSCSLQPGLSHLNTLEGSVGEHRPEKYWLCNDTMYSPGHNCCNIAIALIEPV
jgi:hypothetical protein